MKEYKLLIMSGCNVIFFFKSAVFNMSFVKKEKNRNGYFLLVVSVSAWLYFASLVIYFR